MKGTEQVKQGTEKRPVAERARAARRAAQLQREAQERADAQRKIEEGDVLTKNDILAMLGSAFRLPDDEPVSLVEMQAERMQQMITERQAMDPSVGEFVAQVFAQLAEQDWPDEATEPHGAQSTVSEPPKRRKRGAGYNFTAEDITKLRDEQGLAWRQVAVNLGLESTFAARRAYRNLTGRSPSESKPDNVRRVVSKVGTSRGSTRKVHVTDWSDEADQDEIIERLGNGARILIRRSVGNIMQEEDLVIGRLIKLTWDGKDESGPLVATFTEREGGGCRTVRVADIKEVR